MQVRNVLLATSLLAAVVLAGCTKAPSDLCASPCTVSMKNMAFKPDAVKIKVGQTVTWKNDEASGINHDVTPKQGNETWTPGGKGSLTPGATLERKFEQAGTYNYYCMEHGMTMDGVVTVVA